MAVATSRPFAGLTVIALELAVTAPFAASTAIRRTVAWPPVPVGTRSRPP